MSFSYWKTIQILPVFVCKIFDTLILPIYSGTSPGFKSVAYFTLVLYCSTDLAFSTYCWFSTILLRGTISNTLFTCDLCIKKLTVDFKLKGLDQEHRLYSYCKSLFSQPSGNDWLLWFLSIGIYAFEIPLSLYTF